MNWKKDFRTALVLGTEGLVIAGAGTSVSLSGYSLPRSVRPSLLERLVEAKNTLIAALRRTPDDASYEHKYYDPKQREQFSRFNVQYEIIFNSIRLV